MVRMSQLQGKPVDVGAIAEALVAAAIDAGRAELGAVHVERVVAAVRARDLDRDARVAHRQRRQLAADRVGELARGLLARGRQFACDRRRRVARAVERAGQLLDALLALVERGELLGSALAVLMFLFVLVVSAIGLRVLRRREVEA